VIPAAAWKFGQRRNRACVTRPAQADARPMSSSRSGSAGAQVSGAGALILLVSLWLPWYAVRLPDALRDAFKGLGSGAAQGSAPAGSAQGFQQAFSGFLSGIAAAMPEEITAKGWTALDGADVALAGISAIAILLALSISGSGLVRMDPADAARGLMVVGAIALGIVLYHVISPPGHDAPAIFGKDLVKLRYGLAVAGLGAVCIGIGGMMAGSARAPEQSAASSAPYEPLPGYPTTPDVPAMADAAAMPELAEPAPLTPYPVAPQVAEGKSSAPPGWAPPAA
jgi:hypothetical protein